MRVLGAVVLAVALSWAWLRVAMWILEWSQIGYFTAWAVEGALVALAARVAGRRRWAVAVPLLLVFVGGTAAMFGMLGLLGSGEYELHAGVVLGALFGMFLIGPTILAPAAPAADEGRLPVPAAPPQTRPRGFRLSALTIALGVLGVFLVIVVAQVIIRQRQLEQVRRDILPAVEDLARTDVLAHSGPVVWQGPRSSGWSRRPMMSARGMMSDGGIKLQFIPHAPTREFGSSGEAEGLSVDGLVIVVPQPRVLTGQEAKDLQIVKHLLVSAGLQAELVSRLSLSSVQPGTIGPDHVFYGASRNGVRYLIEVNREWELGKGDYYVHIFCNGMRSATSP
jgi:hypothetical protein